jgi:hypothetical protein
MVPELTGGYVPDSKLPLIPELLVSQLFQNLSFVLASDHHTSNR